MSLAQQLCEERSSRSGSATFFRQALRLRSSSGRRASWRNQPRSSPNLLHGLATLHPRVREQGVDAVGGADADIDMGEQPKSSPTAGAVSAFGDDDDGDMEHTFEKMDTPPEQPQPPQPQPQPQPPPQPPPQQPPAQQQQFASLFESLKDTPAASLRLVSPNARESLIARAALIDAMPDPPPK
ncbi:hypothetical protein FGB62_12g138 [Gracilaria domingensis]|nr:hypothetical protein FGB62_12g138 [Gracilaria domingensis]